MHQVRFLFFFFDRARICRYFGNHNKHIASRLGIRDSLDKRGGGLGNDEVVHEDLLSRVQHLINLSVFPLGDQSLLLRSARVIPNPP